MMGYGRNGEFEEDNDEDLVSDIATAQAIIVEADAARVAAVVRGGHADLDGHEADASRAKRSSDDPVDGATCQKPAIRIERRTTSLLISALRVTRVVALAAGCS
jgi:hypothetical protein